MIADGKKRYSITLDPGLVGEIDKLARRAGMHRGPFIAEVLEDVIANRRLQHARADADELRVILMRRIRAAMERIERI
ncbi:MAG: hypothetical protein OXU75_03185 [Deltaproteobacteria bacterium]|nr:hypothetical protein [Deltaproteobacteria bacterium]